MLRSGEVLAHLCAFVAMHIHVSKPTILFLYAHVFRAHINFFDLDVMSSQGVLSHQTVITEIRFTARHASIITDIGHLFGGY